MGPGIEGVGAQTRLHARAWAAGYASAWRRGDPDAAAALYAEDATHLSSPFRDVMRGREQILKYTKTAYAAEEDPDPRFGEPIVQGGTAVVEWWCSMLEDGDPATLAGASYLDFDENGLVASERDYWNVIDERRKPHRDWG